MKRQLKRVLSLLIMLTMLLGQTPMDVFAMDDSETERISIESEIEVAEDEEEPEQISENNGEVELENDSDSSSTTQEEGTKVDKNVEKTEEAETRNLSESKVASSGICGENVTWTLNDDGVLTIAGEGAMYDFEFDWKYYESTAPWFKQLSSIKKIIIEDGVTNVGNYAFCPELRTYFTDVVIGDDVTTIGKLAFDKCNSLERITIGAKLKYVDEQAFCGTASLHEIHISDLEAWCMNDLGTTIFDWIGDQNGGTYLYLDGAKITELVIPDNIEKIGRAAFAGISGITKVTMHNNVKSIGAAAFAGCDFSEIVLPDSVETIIGNTFSGCENLTSVVLPKDIKRIENGMFLGCRKLTSINIPDGVTSIGAAAFSRTNLNNVIIPNGVISIEDNAFSNTGLNDVIIPNNVESIGNYAFYECNNLKEIVIPDKVTNLGSFALSECDNLEKVILSNNLECINECTFKNSVSISNIVIPEMVTSIGNSAFLGCTNLSKINISTNVTNIGDAAFSGCSSLSNVVLPESIEIIGKNAFQNCSGLKEIMLPSNINAINSNLFSGCSSLESIVLPSGITTIDTCAFNGCSNLSTVTFLGDAPDIVSDAFKTVKATCYYPAENATYTKEILTQDFGGDLLWMMEGEETENEFSCGEKATWEITEQGTLIISGEGAMYDYSVEELNYAPWYEIRSSILAIQIEEGITHIGNAAFYSCNLAKSISMADTVESVGNQAFQSCVAVSTLDLSENLLKIGDNAFRSCGMTNLILPEGITKVGNGAFRGCSKLISVVLPDSLTYISNEMFSYCGKLQDVTFSKNMKSIGDYAFQRSYKLKSIVLPEGLISIGKYAFNECGKWLWGDGGNEFRSVTLPKSIRSIGDYAFADCESLGEINLPYGLEEIGDSAFCWSGIGEIEIPGTVKVIRDGLVRQCRGLKKVIFRGNAPVFEANEKNSLFEGNSNIICYYPADNTTWVKDVMLNYGGKNISWTPIGMEPEGPGNGGEAGGGAGGDGTDGDGTEGGGTEGGGTEGGGTEGGGTEGGGTEGGGTEGGGTEGGGTEGGGTEPGGGSDEYQFYIEKQPTNQTALQNNDTSFIVEAVGEGLSYQWQYSNNGGKNWYNSGISGYNTATQVVTAYSYRDGQMYRCVITHPKGKKLVSDEVTLTVQKMIEIVRQPENQDVKCGENAKFEVEAIGNELVYQWQYSNNGGKNWYNSGLTGYDSDMQLVMAYSYRDGQMYRCIIEDADGNQVITEVATLTIKKEEDVIIRQPQEQSIAVGETAVFTVETVGEGLTYQWQYSFNGSKWYDSTLSGYNTAAQEVYGYASRNGQRYRCIITKTDGSKIMSEEVVLFVK